MFHVTSKGCLEQFHVLATYKLRSLNCRRSGNARAAYHNRL